MRKTSRIIGIVIVCFVLCIGGALLWVSDKYVVPIMMYHSVNVRDTPHTATIHPDDFRAHMEFLKKNNYHVMSLNELVQGIDQGVSFKQKSVVITFDDGYDDNYTYAFQILKDYEYPATFFVPSDKIDDVGRLSLPQLREMVKAGHAIGSHTHTEVYLPDISEDQQEEEITKSKKVLEEKLGAAINYFSYPIGGFSDYIKSAVKRAGYRGACATNRGYDRFNKDFFELNRIRFGNKDNTDMILRTKLSGYYNLFRKLQAPY